MSCGIEVVMKMNCFFIYGAYAEARNTMRCMVDNRDGVRGLTQPESAAPRQSATPNPAECFGKAVIDPVRYSELRTRYRATLAGVRTSRRIRLSSSLLLLFENVDTVLLQLHEVLHCEGWSSARVERCLAEYAPIIPVRDQLRATVMVDGGCPEQCRAASRALQRTGAIVIDCGGLECPSYCTEGADDTEDAVRYIGWTPRRAWTRALVARDTPVRIRLGWTELDAPVELSRSTCDQLMQDLLDPGDPASSLLQRLATAG